MYQEIIVNSGSPFFNTKREFDRQTLQSSGKFYARKGVLLLHNHRGATFCQNSVIFSTTIACLCLLKLVDTLLTVPLDSTVAIVTVWCAVKLIDIEPRAVSHSSIGAWRTATMVAKADLPTDSTFLHCRMVSVQPTSSMCATTVCWDTELRHLCACCPVKAVPATKMEVTFVIMATRH